jgi:biotin synthase-like enzyme
MPHAYTQNDSGSWPRPPLTSPAVPATTELLDAARGALLNDRRQLTLDELSDLASVPDADDGALAALAHEVRLAWCGDVVEVEGILSAKTGGCPEDCQFCSQSARHDSPVKAVPLLARDEVVAAATETAALGASEFCLVAIRWIAIFRLALPDVALRYAGGREVTLGDLQEMGMTAGINALIVGNYLTRPWAERHGRTWSCSASCACPWARGRG